MNISWGFKALDTVTEGIKSGDFIMITGAPSTGKSIFASTIAASAALQEKKSVAFFSLELSTDHLKRNMICSQTNISISKLRANILDSNENITKNRIEKGIAESLLTIDDTAALSINYLCVKARYISRKVGLDLIIIDYLQLLTVNRDYTNVDECRKLELTEILYTLRALANELNVAIILVSQLDSSINERDDKCPTLGDLNKFGPWEEVLDMVLIFYHDENAHIESYNSNMRELIVKRIHEKKLDNVKVWLNLLY